MSPPDRLAAALADRYRLEREVGQGGMATVFLAHDLRHDRKVAIKLLHPELSAVIGGERFLAEIRVTAQLQHPHILGLIDSGACDGLLYYVMPFVEGESLRDRLARETQLPVPEAVRIAREIADGLDYAHRHGVVHRDIKPENILLHDGRALIADFGIARAATRAGESRMTQTGMSLGTPAYMSPEQAMGERDIGPRSDVYALGAVTYEMLVGEPPFTGSTAQAIVAKAMTEKPLPPSRLRDTVPAAVEDAVLAALQKLPADRFATAREFAEALAGPPGASRAATRALPAAARRGGRDPVRLALGTVAAAALALAAWSLARPRGRAGPSVYDAALPDSARLAFGATVSRTGYGMALRNVSVAASGDFAVYAAREGESSVLWYRSLRDGTARRIDGTAGGQAPRVSPDGRLVAFYLGNRVAVVPVAGGETRVLLEVQGPVMLEWLSASSLLAGTEDGYRRTWLDPEAGPVRSVRGARCVFGQWDAAHRELICRGNGIAMVVDPASDSAWTIHSTLPDGAEGPPVAGAGFRVIGGDLLVYVSTEGELRVASYDAAARRIGRPLSLGKGIRAEAVGDAQLDLTADGTLVFGPGINGEIGRVVRLRPGSAPEALVAEEAIFLRFDLSPDRRWLAAVVQAPDGQELRLYDTRDGQRSLLARAEIIRQPLWSPAGDRLVAFARMPGRTAVLRFDPGSARAPDTLVAGDTTGLIPDLLDFPSDREIVAQEWASSLTFRFDPAAPARIDTLLPEARFTSVAPGGRLMSYQNIEGSAISVTTHPVAGRRWQVAPDGAEPLWLSASDLLYRLGPAWYHVRVDPATGEPLDAPVLWARDPRFSDTSGWSNRLSRDGGILYVQGPAETSGGYLRVVPGWAAQARRALADEAR